MNTLWEYLENVLFGWGVTSRDGRQRSTGRRRSIVRMIGSMLPFIKATRVHLNLAVWQNDEFEHSPIHSPVQCNPGSIDEGLDSASTLFCEGIHLQERDDMRKILEEIKELKMKMNEILERQNGGQCCDSGHHNLSVPIIRYDNSNPAPPVPPPPPPPPPPMPTALMAFLPSPMSASTPRIGKSGKQRPSTQPGLNDVLNELKENKFRLKSIPRTPGGRPIKQPSSDSDTPGSNGGETRTDLAEILRKRLQYVQCSDSDCSFSSSFNDSSVLVDHN